MGRQGTANPLFAGSIPAQASTSAVSDQPRATHSQYTPSSTRSMRTKRIHPVTISRVASENLFDDKSERVNNLSSGETITLVATGDVMLSRSVNVKTIQSTNSNWVFDKITPLPKKCLYWCDKFGESTC